jgi:hypothetical protein
MSSDTEAKAHTRLWQQRLLPLMSGMVVVLTLFFFVASFGQLLYLQAEIRSDRPLILSEGALAASIPEAATQAEHLAIARFRATAELELQVVSRRYRQAAVLLMSRVWTLYLGFVTGMILALVGAAFILGKLQEPSSEMGLRSAGGDLTLKTASPGIILAALGTMLMLATIVTHHRIDVTDAPLYLRDFSSAMESTPKDTPPKLDNPLKRPAPQ